MVIRSINEYKALVAKINVKKEDYAKKELASYSNTDVILHNYYEKIKKTNIILVISSAIMVVMLGLIYDMLDIINEKWVISIFASVFSVVYLIIIIFRVYYGIKYKKTNKIKLQEGEANKTIRDDIVSLNHQISILTISIICLNEHFFELSCIKNEELRIKTWKKYIDLHLMAINKTNNYVSTTSAFNQYYNTWMQNKMGEE